MSDKPIGAASRYSQREYGGVFQPRETTVAVGVTQVEALRNDPNRIGLLITNTGTTNITLARNAGIVSGVGILLLGNGASLALSVMEDGDIVQNGFYAISDLAGGSLFIEETVEAFTAIKQE
jgi:hypothetical protein